MKMDKQLRHYRSECECEGRKTTSAVGLIPFCKRCKKSYTEIPEKTPQEEKINAIS